MRALRIVSVTAFALVAIGIAPASAADCKSISNPKKRMDCLEQRLATLEGSGAGSAVKKDDIVALQSEWSAADCLTAVSQNGAVLLRPCSADAGRFARVKVVK